MYIGIYMKLLIFKSIIVCTLSTTLMKSRVIMINNQLINCQVFKEI